MGGLSAQETTTPKSVQPLAATPVDKPDKVDKPADPNLLGKVDTESGEARRNENVFITAIDNNAQKESISRLGSTATATTDFSAASRYFGGEFGQAPTNPIHLAATRAHNAVRGSMFWAHSNSAFSARSFFQAGSVRPARDNLWGARLAAPLWRNAFFSFDGAINLKSGYVNGNVLIPRPQERSCLSPDPRICAIINRFLLAWPNQVPNIDDHALNTNARQSIDTTNTTGRLDQTIAKHRLSARHTWTNQEVNAFQLVAGQNPDTTTKAHDARLTWTYSRDAKTAWDTTMSFTRNRTLLVPEPNAVGPQVQVGTAYEKLGPGSSIPVDRVQNRYRISTRWRRNFIRHTLSAGGEVGRLQFNGREASSDRGNIYFRNDFGRDAITNFRLGMVSRYSFGAGDTGRGFRRTEDAWFVQDVWRVSSTLSVSMGLRYQPQRGIAEVHHLTEIPFNCDCNNFGPNLGLAWRAPRRFGVLRAAYSTQYGEVFPATLQQLRWNPPGFQKVETQAPPLLNLLEGVVFDPGARAIVFHYPKDLKTPYSHQYTFSWGTPIPKSLGKLELSYVGSRTWKLLYMHYDNRALPVAGIPQTTATINLRRPDPRYFDYREISNSARAYYDAAKITHTLTAGKGVSFETSYWFSKAIDTGASFVNIAAGDDANQGHAQTATDVAKDLRAVSAFDQKHALLSRATYPLDGHGRLLKDWRLSSVFLAKSGLPFTVITGSDAPGYGNVDGVSGDRPNLLDRSILGRTISHPDVAQQLLPRAAFGYIKPTEQAGNLGVNVFRRAGFRNLNASIERRFAVQRDRALLFRTEAINLLNTPQFAEPIADLSNSSFGKITNTLNDGRGVRFSLSFEF